MPEQVNRDVVVRLRTEYVQRDSAAEIRKLSEAVQKLEKQMTEGAKKATEERTKTTKDGEKERQKALKETAKAHETATRQIKIAHEQMGESLRGLVGGTVKLARGFALMGIAGEEDTKKLIKGLIRIQAAFDLFTGSLDMIAKGRKLWQGYTTAVAAATAAQQAQNAAQAAGATTAGTRAAAGAGGLLGMGRLEWGFVGLTAAAGAAGLALYAFSSSVDRAAEASKALVVGTGKGAQAGRAQYGRIWAEQEAHYAARQRTFGAGDPASMLAAARRQREIATARGEEAARWKSNLQIQKALLQQRASYGQIRGPLGITTGGEDVSDEMTLVGKDIGRAREKAKAAADARIRNAQRVFAIEGQILKARQQSAREAFETSKRAVEAAKQQFQIQQQMIDRARQERMGAQAGFGGLAVWQREAVGQAIQLARQQGGGALSAEQARLLSGSGLAEGQKFAAEYYRQRGAPQWQQYGLGAPYQKRIGEAQAEQQRYEKQIRTAATGRGIQLAGDICLQWGKIALGFSTTERQKVVDEIAKGVKGEMQKASDDIRDAVLAKVELNREIDKQEQAEKAAMAD